MLTKTLSTLKMLELQGGEVTKIKLMKLMFLVKQGLSEDEATTFYGFVPYHYGPYSFDLQREVTKLVNQGYLFEKGDSCLGLTNSGREKSQCLKKESLVKTLLKTSMRYKPLSQKEILAKVYREYSWYTLNTKLSGWQKPERPVADKAIYTVGYQGLQIDDFLNLLIRKGIHGLLDVRKNPVARRYGLHKSSLQKLAGHLGIEYKHVPQLGIPSNWRSKLETEEDYRKLLARYTIEILSEQKDNLRDVARIINERPTVMMCMETNPQYCHRTHLGYELRNYTDLKVKDLRGGNAWADN